ncbi:hypothetical protein BGX20_007854, partial [Mortierella sp. AD010]
MGSFADWEWEKEVIQGGEVDRAFACVHMENHWGVLCVDFKKNVLSFGDSYRRLTPPKAIDAAMRWLKNTVKDFSMWENAERNVGRFSVPPQSGGGSCGIIAANAIETAVNPAAERWTPERSAFHRA